MNSNLPVKTDTREIARFADGQVFVRKTPDGQVKAVKTIMELSLRKKEMASVGGSMMITTYGFDQMNRVAGLSVIYPPEINITVDRRGFLETAKVENPYIEYDEDGSIKVITTECLAIGLSPIGNWCITQERLRFDLRQYFIAEVWSKVKDKPACGSFKTRQAHDADTNSPNNMWVPVMSGCGLSVDLMHPEITKVITSHITRQKFAERIATSICRRNAMKRHPAIAQSLVQPTDGYAEVEVVGWQHDKSADEIREIVSSVATQGVVPGALQHGAEPLTIDGKAVEVVTEDSQLKFGDEEKAAVEDEVTEDDMDRNRSGSGISPEQGTLFEEEQSSIGDREKNLIYLGELEDGLGTKPMNEVIDDIASDTPDVNFAEMNDDQLSALVSKLKEWDRTRKR